MSKVGLFNKLTNMLPEFMEIRIKSQSSQTLCVYQTLSAPRLYPLSQLVQSTLAGCVSLRIGQSDNL